MHNLPNAQQNAFCRVDMAGCRGCGRSALRRLYGRFLPAIIAISSSTIRIDSNASAGPSREFVQRRGGD